MSEQRIARMERDDLLANAQEVIDAASAKLKALIGGERFTMSVPVQDSDTDIPLGAVIRLAKAQAEALALARRDSETQALIC